jgi:hypothetical protein
VSLSTHLLHPAVAISLLALATLPAFSGPRAPKKPPRLALLSDIGGEYTVEAEEFEFVYFRRTFYNKAAPRSANPAGRRIEVLDRRYECNYLRLPDWSKIKLKELRQIGITYPQGSREALLQLTYLDGRVTELPASGLYGAQGPFPPRFGATIDGVYREFPLVLSDNAPDGWPQELLTRVLLVISSPPKSKRSRRGGGD